MFDTFLCIPIKLYKRVEFDEGVAFLLSDKVSVSPFVPNLILFANRKLTIVIVAFCIKAEIF